MASLLDALNNRKKREFPFKNEVACQANRGGHAAQMAARQAGRKCRTNGEARGFEGAVEEGFGRGRECGLLRGDCWCRGSGRTTVHGNLPLHLCPALPEQLLPQPSFSKHTYSCAMRSCITCLGPFHPPSLSTYTPLAF